MTTKNFLLLSVITFALFSFSKDKSVEKYTPPGTVKIGAQFFMDETEITNISWKEYTFWTERIYGKGSSQYEFVKADSHVWEEPFRSLYFTHPAYDDYPVVGVSYDQALAFCQWRSERVMEQLLINQKLKKLKSIPSQVYFRLPTKAEWENVAKVGYSEKTQKSLDKKHKNCVKANYQTSPTSEEVKSTTAPVYSYWPNRYGVRQMFGNVSEMILNEGVAKGGSWTDFENDIHIDTNIPYTHPSKSIGFRCVCEVSFEEIDS